MDSTISVIITTYKRNEYYLNRAIKSVLNQTFQNIDLIVVDDNGLNTEFQKSTAHLINKLNENHTINYVVNDVNSGAQISRNNGIDQSKGTFIAFLDDDDEWLNDKLKEQYNVFLENKDTKLGLVYCDYFVVNESKGKSETKTVEVPEFSSDEALTELLRVNYIASTSLPLIKRECFDRVGNFDITLLASQDYDMWVRILKEYDVKAVNKPLANYYKHEGERITSNLEKKEKAEKDFLKKHYDYISKDKKALSEKHKKIGIYLMKQRKNKEARDHFTLSIKNNPFGVRIYKYFLQTIYQS